MRQTNPFFIPKMHNCTTRSNLYCTLPPQAISRRILIKNIIMSLRKTLARRVTADAESTPATSKSVMNMKKEHQLQTFPFKLYEMIEYACKYEFISSLSWSADGSIFIIHDKDAMMGDLAPMFFKQTKFRSFVSDLLAVCIDLAFSYTQHIVILHCSYFRQGS